MTQRIIAVCVTSALVVSVGILGSIGTAGSLQLHSASPKVYPNQNVGVIGHGWGHGFGMGQWGALGYALDQENYSWILNHYYGGTTPGTVTNEPLRVVITANDGNTTIVTSNASFTVDTFNFAAGQAAMFVSVSNNQWAVYQGDGCAGPWGLTPLETVSSPIATSSIPGPDATKDQVLQLCLVQGNEYLRGKIEPASFQGSARTVNVVPVESYLRGVVPSESPAYWGNLGAPGPQGQNWGFQQLEVQAIAARSYALSSLGQYGYADICDSTSCQVYGGLAAENTLTDQAVEDTAGQVLDGPNGQVAETQFSASTGGYTSGGVFPAVPDVGDSVCVPSACNPNHIWTSNIPVSQIEASWPSIGTLSSISVVQRDGNGDFGGRAEKVQITGSAGTVTVSGTEFESYVGLNSDFFAFTGTPSGGANGYWLASQDGSVYSFGSAASYGSPNQTKPIGDIISIVPTVDSAGYWVAGSDGTVFAFGDAVNSGDAAGVSVKPIVGMTSTPDGKGYWLVATDGGIFSYGDAQFYGSTGAMSLAKPIVGMTSSPDGKGYWLVASDGGIFAFGDAQFFGSTGAMSLAKPIIAMTSTPDGKGYWLVASDGGIFAFGDAQFFGSMPGESQLSPTASIVSTPDGMGYLIATTNGEVHSFGDAPLFGDLSTPAPGYSGTISSIALKPGS